MLSQPSAIAQVWKAVEERFNRAAQLSPAELTLAKLREDPCYTFEVLGLKPDPWQIQALTNTAPAQYKVLDEVRSQSPLATYQRYMLVWSRQVGKSLVVAAMGLRAALCYGAKVLIVSPVIDQSGIIYEYALQLYYALGEPVGRKVSGSGRMDKKEKELHLSNGGSVIPRSDTESIRGFPDVGVVILEEAALVEDHIYHYVIEPMLVRKAGVKLKEGRRLIALSTTRGQRGWVWEAWSNPNSTFMKNGPITIHDCPHVDWDMLNKARASGEIDPRAWAQEYECDWKEVEGAVFSSEDLSKVFKADGAYRPLWPDDPGEVNGNGNDGGTGGYRPVVEAF